MFPLLHTVQVDTVYQNVFYNSRFLLFLRHGIKKNKITYSTQVSLYCVLLKEIISVK